MPAPQDHTPSRLLAIAIAAALAATCALTSGCAATVPACAGGQQRATTEHIYFGAQTPDGPVSNDAWNAFLAEVVTPRFPAGLTAWEAAGQWRSADGSLTREPSRVLNLVHLGDAASEAAVLAIIDHYKRRYRQEAVLRVQASACMSL